MNAYKSLYTDDISSPLQIIKIRAKNDPESIAFRYKRKKQLYSITCGRFWQDINIIAAYFSSHNLHNTRIGLLSENSYECILSWFAIMASGNIVVPIDKDQNPEYLSSLFGTCGVKTLICSDMYYDLAEKFQNDGVVDECLNLNDISSFLKENTYSSDEQISGQYSKDVCAILFTSGTTGTQKGVMLTHKNIASDALYASRSLWLPGSSVLTLPLHHMFGITVGVLSAYICGYPIYISKSLRTFNDDLKTFGPENIVVVPLYIETMYKKIWETAKELGKDNKLRRMVKVSNCLRKVGIDLRQKFFGSILREFGGNLRHIVCGGAFLDQKYINGFDDLGIMVLNGYGITECSPVVSVNRKKDRRKGSVGLPLPGVDVKIINDEICVKGSIVMSGYFEDTASTAEVMQDGWFHTGDLGYMDKAGYLYITGRKKNLIILSNGENVSAEELETLILEIKNVEEVLVHAKNNHITAEIYTKDPTGIDEAIENLNRKLPSFKRIKQINYCKEQFEKTTTQKIKRT